MDSVPLWRCLQRYLHLMGHGIQDSPLISSMLPPVVAVSAASCLHLRLRRISLLTTSLFIIAAMCMVLCHKKKGGGDGKVLGRYIPLSKGLTPMTDSLDSPIADLFLIIHPPTCQKFTNPPTTHPTSNTPRI
jgi:hypothetical protein